MVDKKNYKKLPIYLNKKEGEYIDKLDIVNNFPNNFLIVENDNKKIEYATTSGTTSNRMEIIRKKNWWKDEYKRTYQNSPLLKEYLEKEYNKAIFTTAQCSNLMCFMDNLPMEKRIINNTLYVNSTFNPWTWTKENIENITNEMNIFKPYYLDADPVYLAIYLLLYKKYKIKEKLYIPKVITLSYEYVSKNIRKFIENFYNTTILNLYGTTECGYVFMEDVDGKMKLCPELIDVKLKLVDKKNNIYSLIIDSLKNEYMPLINYKVGDMVEVTEEDFNKFDKEYKITRMAGREKDYEKIQIPITVIDDIMSKFNNILIYQIQYISEDKSIMKYETQDFEDIENKVKEEIKSLLYNVGITNVEIKHVPAISPERSGKFAIFKFEED